MATKEPCFMAFVLKSHDKYCTLLVSHGHYAVGHATFTSDFDTKCYGMNTLSEKKKVDPEDNPKI